MMLCGNKLHNRCCQCLFCRCPHCHLSARLSDIRKTRPCDKPIFLRLLKLNIYIIIAIALNESIFFYFLHFPLKNIKSRDLEATPMGGATSKPTSDAVCLLLLT